MISCLCVTYGRVRHLEEMIHSFLIQTVHGQGIAADLTVINTMPEQTLIWEPSDCCGPQVRIVNLDRRPPSIGAARNMALRYADPKARWVMAWDDDDIYYPEYIEQHLPLPRDSNALWTKMSRAYYMNDFQIVSEVDMTIQSGLVDINLAREIGYPETNHGEDRVFWNAVRERPGFVYTAANPRLVFGYGWQNQVHHISGNEGKDFSKMYALWGSRQSHGDIVLRPGWRRDYVADREVWVNRSLPAR